MAACCVFFLDSGAGNLVRGLEDAKFCLMGLTDYSRKSRVAYLVQVHSAFAIVYQL